VSVSVDPQSRSYMVCSHIPCGSKIEKMFSRCCHSLLVGPLSRLRTPCFLSFSSLKREMRKLAQEDCGFEEPTVAMAFVYFEKLALRGKLNKQNRKLCAGACVLLAAKVGSDLRKHEVKHLIDVSELRSMAVGRPWQAGHLNG
jgi:hypothetical protein